jgi:hypothetical protein
MFISVDIGKPPHRKVITTTKDIGIIQAGETGGMKADGILAMNIKAATIVINLKYLVGKYK